VHAPTHSPPAVVGAREIASLPTSVRALMPSMWQRGLADGDDLRNRRSRAQEMPRSSSSVVPTQARVPVVEPRAIVRSGRRCTQRLRLVALFCHAASKASEKRPVVALFGTKRRIDCPLVRHGAMAGWRSSGERQAARSISKRLLHPTDKEVGRLGGARQQQASQANSATFWLTEQLRMIGHAGNGVHLLWRAVRYVRDDRQNANALGVHLIAESVGKASRLPASPHAFRDRQCSRPDDAGAHEETWPRLILRPARRLGKGRCAHIGPPPPGRSQSDAMSRRIPFHDAGAVDEDVENWGSCPAVHRPSPEQRRPPNVQGQRKKALEPAALAVSSSSAWERETQSNRGAERRQTLGNGPSDSPAGAGDQRPSAEQRRMDASIIDVRRQLGRHRRMTR